MSNEKTKQEARMKLREVAANFVRLREQNNQLFKLCLKHLEPPKVPKHVICGKGDRNKKIFAWRKEYFQERKELLSVLGQVVGGGSHGLP